jgi:hypothetical protein
VVLPHEVALTFAMSTCPPLSQVARVRSETEPPPPTLPSSPSVQQTIPDRLGILHPDAASQATRAQACSSEGHLPKGSEIPTRSLSTPPASTFIPGPLRGVGRSLWDS